MARGCDGMVKILGISCVVLTLLSSPGPAQEVTILGKEPQVEELGAPLYPGASFVRTLSSLDPYYETVIYVAPDPVGDVKNWFRDALPDARVVQYRDENEWVWTYLLADWIPFPDKPTRDDLPILDVSPNVLVRKYQRVLFEPLVEFLESREGTERQLEALANAKTIVRYTFRKIEEDIAFRKIIGTWVNTDRDLPEYYGSIYRFNPDSTYTYTLTPDNVRHLAEKLSGRAGFKGKSTDEIETFIRERNPETGEFAIMRNTIDMFVGSEPVGDEVKSGLTEVGKVIMTMQLINMPRLTFVRRADR